jgi:hypothetical protein
VIGTGIRIDDDADGELSGVGRDDPPPDEREDVRIVRMERSGEPFLRAWHVTLLSTTYSPIRRRLLGVIGRRPQHGSV